VPDPEALYFFFFLFFLGSSPSVSSPS
jgi:hypothetical protein